MQGCSFDAKQSQLVTHLPAAVAAGARIFADCQVDRVLLEKGRAVGVAARFLDYATTHHKLWTASTDDHQHVRQQPYRKPPSGTPRSTVDRLLAR